MCIRWTYYCYCCKQHIKSVVKSQHCNGHLKILEFADELCETCERKSCFAKQSEQVQKVGGHCHCVDDDDFFLNLCKDSYED